MRRLLTAFALFAVVATSAPITGTPALAVEPDEVLADAVLEGRARELSKLLRCVVCQNQSIDDSNADIARDMRLVVRERLVSGDTDDEVVAFMVARYGDYVLLRPPFQNNTLALWIGPPLMALVLIALAFVFFRSYQHGQSRAAGGAEPLSPTDRAQLDALVEQLAAEVPQRQRKSALRSELDEPFGDNGDGDNTLK